MALLNVGQEFNSFNELLQSKNEYETAKNVILVIGDSHKLKGDTDFVKTMIYDRLSLKCKAGKERPSNSRGIRQVATYKKNCSMKVNFACKNNKLIVTSMVDTHENHQVNPQTFRHYPEKIRLSKEEKEQATIMLETDGKKQKNKTQLMAKRMEEGNPAPISLKALHNLRTAVRIQKQQLLCGENELQKLLKSMLKVPNAIVRVLKDDNNDLCCRYFQDKRMVDIFDKKPELLLFDDK